MPIKSPLLPLSLLISAAMVMACSKKAVPESSSSATTGATGTAGMSPNYGRPAARNSTHRYDVSNTTASADIINYVNAYRKTKKLGPLKVLYIATQEALVHSREMAAKKVAFGHTGFQQRALAISKDLNGTSATGENVAYGINMTPKEVVNAWLKSPVHRANIVGDFNLTGVGIAQDVKGRIYYTQLFVKK